MKSPKSFVAALMIGVAFIPSVGAAPAINAAKQDLAIAAVVGEEAVSSYDVDNRIKFVMVTTRLSNTPDVLERIRPQVIRSLIDEKLQLQEATKNDITITPKDIEDAMAAIEQQRGMPSGAIKYMLQDNRVPEETFIQQIKAQLAWNKLLMRKIRPHVRVSDEEIQLASQRIKAAPAPKQMTLPQELKIAVITLPVDKASREAEVGKLGDKLVNEMRGGASFEEISRQFSSVTASAGGKIETFWIKPAQLDSRIAKALMGASSGTITNPVRTNEGFTIIKVYDTRGQSTEQVKQEEKPKDIEVSLKEILLKLKYDANSKEADVLLQIGEEVAKHPGTCEEKGIANIKDLTDIDIQVDFRKAVLSELPPAIRIIAENLKVGDISTPFASADGIVLYMLCDKKEVAAKPVDRDRVYAMLMQEKMELEAQKYMRNLRRDAFVEIR